MALPAKVIQVMGRSGAKGVSRVRCTFVDNMQRNKVLVRNVMGSVRVGDILMVKESDMEDAGVIE
ncbi:MAG: 30S ribosomal protein S28e [archaeon]